MTTTLKGGEQFPTGIIEGPPGPPGPAGQSQSQYIYKINCIIHKMNMYKIKTALFSVLSKQAVDSVSA